jgi:quercetin dioxygenase-like cupin family protein
MVEKAGRIINPAAENRTVPGCTVSKQIYHKNGLGLFIFSLASGTDISAESYSYHKLWIVYEGEMTVHTTDDRKENLSAGQCFITPVDVPIGIQADEDSIYMEIELPKDAGMNSVLKVGKTFNLAELLPYQEGRIVNMDLLNDEKMKFVIMSFDAGTGLAEHAAPGEAFVLALNGKAVIRYEGRPHEIHAGEIFKFDKMGRHAVEADDRFKMALLLILK